MPEISDFVTEGPVPADVIDEFRDRVPEEVVEVWEQYGYGTFADGFIRVIDPRVYGDQLSGCLGRTQGEGVSIPVMVTGMADVIAWEPGLGATGIIYRQRRVQGLGSWGTFFVLVAMDPNYLEEDFGRATFDAAVALQGPPAFDESFIHVPLLSLGGADKPENLAKRDTLTSIQLMVETDGVIGH